MALRVNSGSVTSLLSDHLGSTVRSATASGSPGSELRYRAFGETRYAAGTLPTRRRYTGQLQDVETGLYFYGARYYDPLLGRFLQPDTIVPEPGNPLAYDRYAYALNNPLRYTDPTGHVPCYGDGPNECSSAGATNRRFSAASRQRQIRQFARFLEKQVAGESMTALEAMAEVWGFASLFGMDARTTANDVSQVLVGAGGTHTLLGGMALKGKEFLTGRSLHLPDLGDTGFHPNYRDGFNQPYHFWSYVNTTAQGGLLGWPIGEFANEVHEKWDPTEAIKPEGKRGTSWEDYFLSYKGMHMGYLLHTGALSVDEAGAWMRRELASPAGPLYSVAKATGTWWWPSVWMQKAVDITR